MRWGLTLLIVGALVGLVAYMLALVWPAEPVTPPARAGLPDSKRIEPIDVPQYEKRPPPPPIPDVTQPPPERKRAYLGLETKIGKDYGVRIERVYSGSPAQKAGLLRGDMIYSINDTPVHNPRQITRLIFNHYPGDDLIIVYYRDGERAQVSVRLE